MAATPKAARRHSSLSTRGQPLAALRNEQALTGRDSFTSLALASTWLPRPPAPPLERLRSRIVLYNSTPANPGRLSSLKLG